MNTDRSGFQAVWIMVMSVGSWILNAFAGMFIARSMSPKEFGYFGVIVVSISVVAIVCNFGLEKLALRIVPHYRVTGEWPKARGYLRFAPLAQLMLSLAVGLVVLAVCFRQIEVGGPWGLAIGVAVLFLPFIVLVSYFLELANARGRYFSAIAVYRVVLPFLTLSGVLTSRAALGNDFTATIAVICYGLPWLIVLTPMLALSRGALPQRERRGKCEYALRLWIGRAISFFAYSLVLAFLGNSGLMAMGCFHLGKDETGYFAAATQLSGILTVVATSTNRYYLPRMSVYLDTDNSEELTAMFRSRRLLMRGLFVIYFLTVLIAGRPILGLYGEHYEYAWIPWMILATGQFFALECAHAAAYLQYHHHERDVYTILALCVGLIILSVFPLTLAFGIRGAATGNAVSACVLFSWLSRRAFRLRKEILESHHKSHLMLNW